MSKPQVFYIHGGNTFKCEEDYLNYLRNKKVKLDKKDYWPDSLVKTLGDDVQMITPKMPLKEDAKYRDWKIFFERYIPFLNDNLILIGTSLGGIFLAKYLSENKFPKKIHSVYLVAPPFDNSLSNEDLAGGFELGDDLKMIEENCKNVNLMFSKNDTCVPVEHAKKYSEKLKDSKIIVYDEIPGHFDIERFPEIEEMIGEDLKALNG